MWQVANVLHNAVLNCFEVWPFEVGHVTRSDWNQIQFYDYNGS